MVAVTEVVEKTELVVETPHRDLAHEVAPADRVFRGILRISEGDPLRIACSVFFKGPDIAAV